MNTASHTCLLLASTFTVAGYAQTPERELAVYGQDLAVYQQDLLRAARNLRKRNDADSIAAAALFSVRSDPANALRLIGQARSVVPGRPELTLLHVQICTRSVGCDPKPLESEMRKQDPQNGVGWSGDISRAYEGKNEEALDAAIGAAGRARQFNSYFMTLAARLSEATAKSKSMPLNDAIIAVSGELAGFGLPNYPSISRGCAAERMKRPGLLEFCRQLAAALMAGDTLIAEGIGVAIAKRAWPIDSPQWQAATEVRRVSNYRSTTLSNLESTGNWDEANAANYLRLIKAHPREQEALTAQLVAQDVDPTPPDGWGEPEKP
jgi:hypothetical protein